MKKKQSLEEFLKDPKVRRMLLLLAEQPEAIPVPLTYLRITGAIKTFLKRLFSFLGISGLDRYLR